MVDQINWDYAVVERLNTKDLRVEIIPFNLGKAVLQKDPANNIVLQPGDVVTILSSTDVQLPAERKTRLVRIEGEVAAPGVYQAKAGETLPQLLQRVGGLTPQAYVYGTEFTRESVRKQQQANLDQVIRRLETQGQSAGATLAANLTGDRVAQAATLQQQGLRAQGYVVFAPGAEYGPAKRWPAAHFSALAQQLDKPVVLLGSGKEAALCEDIAGPVNALRPHQCRNLAGATSLMEAFALIAAAHRVVSNDSGLMHVAAALGVPLVALYGSSSPAYTPPLSEHAIPISLKLACSPCFKRDCPLGHTNCLKDITPESVLTAIERIQSGEQHASMV
jgi:hypothetical protein